ncbi:hypothetical protein M1731_23215, partial [Salmonella enterica subsp. enterica serovar Javiana]|uniref:hypothetical protein n=1 Tax=Salmonella enterica TaxID=28901 RepID=UPI0021B24266
PSAPDEPIPLAEADKLKGVNLSQITGLAGLDTVSQQLSSLNSLAVTTSRNWAIGPQRSRSRSGKSLLANDLAAQPQAPSPWNYV